MRCSLELTGKICLLVPEKDLLVASWEKPSLRSTVHLFRSSVGLSLWVVTLASAKRQRSPWHGQACFVWGVFFCPDFSAGQQLLLPGFFTYRRLKAADFWLTARIT